MAVHSPHTARRRGSLTAIAAAASGGILAAGCLTGVASADTPDSPSPSPTQRLQTRTQQVAAQPVEARPHRRTQPLPVVPTPGGATGTPQPVPTPTATPTSTGTPAPVTSPTPQPTHGGSTAWSGGFAGFNSDAWKKTWGVSSSGAWGGSNLAEDSDGGAPAGGVLKASYGAGSSANSCADCPSTGGGQFYTSLAAMGLGDLANGATLDLKYSLKLPSGFDFGLAGKLPGLYGGTIGEESGGNHGNGWSTRYMWRGNNSAPDNGEVYVYTPTVAGPTGYGDDTGLGDWKWPADGRWHTVEQLVNRSTGDITVWFDGQQVYSMPGVAKGISSIPFGGIFFSTFYGGHDTTWGPKTAQQSFFAGFSLSTGPQH